MSNLQESYQACEQIAQSSGSNFYRAFEFLRLDRRRAMTALYAFSRLADDATDDGQTNGKAITPSDWNLDDWMHWLDDLDSNQKYVENPSKASDSAFGQLQRIRLALADSIERFGIPKEALREILRGVDQDTRPFHIERYDQLQAYMFRVASAVGLACIAIWSDNGAAQVGSPAYRMGVDCGHAFQLTNILRDLVEDAQRDRIYLANEDLMRTGFTKSSLLESLKLTDPALRQQAITNQGNWQDLIEIYTQRAAACYRSSWGLSDLIHPDSRRMFCMIWSTYHSIFEKIQQSHWSPLHVRPSLSSLEKLRLYASHAWTPRFKTISRRSIKTPNYSNIAPGGPPKVAVIGGGLAGIQTAMHLAKHGCETWLIESRNRLGGRVGSFTDPKSQQAVDYCQHVGMRCCSELVRWMNDLGQKDQWQEQSTLWFRSRHGRRFLAKAWPLPAPLHLSGLLLKWPDLGLIDRTTIAMGLVKLIRTRPDDKFNDTLAIDWLKESHQTSNAIESFWSTILVSALGEQLPRITMGAVHKVIIDGFAASKDAYHLLVPQKSLSHLVDQTAKDCLNRLGVHLVEGKTVTGLSRTTEGMWKLQTRATGDDQAPQDEFHAVVVAVPWHRLEGILDPNSSWMQPEVARSIQEAQTIESAPITGVHTWWSKPWFNDPHAILINRLSQWIFPGPNEPSDAPIGQPIEHYYQVVISGSRDLPKGDSESILKMVQEDLYEVFEELRNSGAVMTRGKVITDPQSVFSVNTRHNRARLECDTLGAQGIFLAGDWVQTGWPATMEGALRSGSLAAGSVLSYVGRPADVSVDGK